MERISNYNKNSDTKLKIETIVCKKRFRVNHSYSPSGEKKNEPNRVKPNQTKPKSIIKKFGL